MLCECQIPEENIPYEHFMQRAINKGDGEGGRIYYITSKISYHVYSHNLLTLDPE